MATPTFHQLARLRPNAKGDTYMSQDRKRIEFKYQARLGRHGVVCEGEPQLWDTEEEALAAAKRFLVQCRDAIKAEA